MALYSLLPLNDDECHMLSFKGLVLYLWQILRYKGYNNKYIMHIYIVDAFGLLE